MAAGSSAMSIDVALSYCRGASRDAFSLPQERGCAGNDKVSFLARRYNINSTSVGITNAIGKDYAERGHCCPMYCTYERGRIRLELYKWAVYFLR